MKLGLAAGLGAMVFGLALEASAQQTPPQQDTGSPGTLQGEQQPVAGADTRNVYMNKHLTLVDAYLANAINSTKALSSLSDMQLDAKDKKLVSELNKNIDTNINMAMKHIQGLQKEKMVMGEKQPVAGVDVASSLDSVHQNLKQAQISSKKLGRTSYTNLSPAISTVAADLMSAHESFKEIAQATQLKSIDTVQLETEPVRGTEEMPAPKKTQEPMKTPGGY